MSAETGDARFRVLSDFSALFADIKRARAELSGMAAGAATAGAAMGASLSSAGQTLTRAGRGLTVGVTAPLVIGFKKAIDVFNEFDDKAARTSLVLSATAEESKLLRDEAIRLGAAFGRFSAQDATDGMYELASAGLNTREVLGAIGPTLELAEAAGIGVGEAALVSAGTMRAFGLSVEDLSHVNDVLAVTLQKSAFHGEELGQALAHAGVLGATMGQDLESVMTGLIAIRNQGVPAAQAGVALRQAMTRLSAPLPKAKKALEGLGIELREIDGTMKQFPDIVREFQNAFAGDQLEDYARSMNMSTAEAKDWVTAQVFGVEGAKAMGLALNATTILINDGAEGTAQLVEIMGQDFVDAMEAGEEATVSSADALDAIESSLRNSDGVAKGFAETMNKTLGAAMKNTGGAFESLAIAIVDQLAPALISFLNDTLIPLIGRVTEFIQKNPDAVKQFAKMAAAAAAAGPALLIIGGALRLIGGFLTGISGGGLLTMITRLLGPIGLLISLLATAIASSPELQSSLMEAFGGLAQAAGEIMSALGPAFVAVAQALVPVFVAGAEAVVLLVNAMLPFIETVAGFISANPELIASLLAGVLAFKGWYVLVGAATTLLGLLPGAIAFVTGALSTLSSLIIGPLAAAFAFLLANPIVLVIAALAALAILLIANWSKVGPFFASAWEWIKSTFAVAIDYLKSLFFNFTAAGLIIKHWSSIVSFFQGVWAGIKAAVSSGVNWVKSYLMGIVTAISNVVQSFLNLRQRVLDAMNRVVAVIKEKAQAAKDWLSRLNPFAKFSPSLVSQVEHGVKIIGREYGSLGKMDLDGPRVTTTFADGENPEGKEFKFAQIAVLIADVSQVEPIKVTGDGGGSGGGGGGSGFDDAIERSGIGRAFESAADAVRSNGGRSAGGLGGGGMDALDDLGESFDSASSNVDEFGNAVGTFVNQGQLDKFAAGLESVLPREKGRLRGASPDKPKERRKFGGTFDTDKPIVSTPTPLPSFRRKFAAKPIASAPAPIKAGDYSPAALKARGDASYTVNNPVAEETEDSLRKIAARRTYLGANGTSDTKLLTTASNDRTYAV